MDSAKSNSSRIAVAVLLALAVLHVVLTRLSWLGTPLQTDAGIWAYIGGRILDGATIYRDLWDNKPPGIFYAFAFIEWLFGRGADTALFWNDAALSVIVGALTYAIARRFASRTASAAAVLLFSVVFCHRELADWGCTAEKFVGVCEVAACLIVFGSLDNGSKPRWLICGLLCGGAMLFKQTGVALLIALTIVCATRRPKNWINSIALLWAGVILVWSITAAWLASRGILADFWRQVVWHDFHRAGSAELEGSRLLTLEHWQSAARHLGHALLVLGPMLFTAIICLRGSSEPTPAKPPTGLIMLLAHAGLIVLLFLFAPYAFGHYLLQAAPSAAAAGALALDRALSFESPKSYRYAMTIWLIAGVIAISDHFRFTLDPTCEPRVAYRMMAERTHRIVNAVKTQTTPAQSVMVWPTDHAVNYYAARRTPLEIGHSIDIFRDRIRQLDPPMPELFDRLGADPPDAIVDWTDVQVVAMPKPEGGHETVLLVQSCFSFLEGPADDHPKLEGQLLAPLKRWVRANYGGQVRVDDACTLYYRGAKWKNWEEYLRAK